MGTVPRPPRPGKSLAELKPSRALEWDYEKNYPYTPETVGANSASLFWWVCQLDSVHAWQQSPNGRREKYGCPGCSGQRTFQGSNDLATTHPELCLEWNPDNTLTPSEVSRGSDYRAKWVCSRDQRHLWETSPYERTRVQSTGCPACAGRMLVPGVNDLVTTHPLLAEEWCSDNNVLSPHEVMPGSSTRAWWRCRVDDNHSWQTKVDTRTRQMTGCPHCRRSTISKVENRLREKLGDISNLVVDDTRTIDVPWGVRGRNAEVDVLTKLSNGLKMIVEYDAYYWHLSRIDEDTRKTTALLEAGYVVIRVRETGLPWLKISDTGLHQIWTGITYPHNTDSNIDAVVDEVREIANSLL